MIASLPMYDMAHLRAANDQLWHQIRANLGFGPKELNRDGDVWTHWQSKDLVFSQTCGMPFRNHLHGKVQLIGTPDYGVCSTPGYYNSVFVVRAGQSTQISDYAEQIFAFNESISQSGWSAPQCHVAKLGFRFENLVQSYGHAKSAAMVASGAASIASLDVVTWNLIKDSKEFAGLQTIEETEPTPGLPFITSSTMNRDQMYSTVADAIEKLDRSSRRALGVKGLVQIPAQDYLRIANPSQ